jgi:hypothetical protein
MTHPLVRTRRYRTNPFEIVVFVLVSLICFRSIYSLFYDQQSFRAAALTPISNSPISDGMSRSPAGFSSQSFLNFDIKCEGGNTKETTATKVRLTGNLCGMLTGISQDVGNQLMKSAILNQANKFNATVFTDVSAGKFSTDYIPLNSGENPIKIEFTYKNGKVFTQEFNVSRN